MDKTLLRRSAFAQFVAFFALTLAARAQAPGAPHTLAVSGENGMVVAQEATAARIGIDILQKGGNAVDAAVAVGFAMAVTFPRAGNIGGGGFMVIHRSGGENTTIDYREMAPQAINKNSFLDAQGNADPEKSRNSAFAIGVPGTVGGALRTNASNRNSDIGQFVRSVQVLDSHGKIHVR